MRAHPWLLAWLLAAAAQAAEPELPPFELVKVNEHHAGNWRHAGSYPPFRIVWRVEPSLRSALAVFPHPVLPQRVLLASASGLLLSDDAGRTWRPLPQSGALGRVRDVAFDPVAADRFVAATDGKGVWASEDAGKTLRCIGTRARGMASDETRALCLYAADRRRQTLIVGHGGAAPGLSVSEDGGGAWQAVAPGFHVYHTHDGPPGALWLYFDAARTAAPDAHSIYATHSLGEPWYELFRDVLPTDLCDPVHRGHALLATAASGVHVLTESGTTPLPEAPDGLKSLASLGVTWNSHADSQLFYAYEPREQGLIVSTDEFAHVTTHSRGLFTGSFVREGAHVRAAADGQVFLAAVNGSLYRGVRLGGALRVSQVAVTPPSVSIARRQHANALRHVQAGLAPLAQARDAVAPARNIIDCLQAADAAVSCQQVSVTARVTGQGKPTAVTLDASRLGGSVRETLRDDGRHGDGQAGDGVYGAALSIAPAAFHTDGNDWRRPWPGVAPLTVTAIAEDGSLAAAVGLLALHERTEPFSMSDSYQYWRASDSDMIGIAGSGGIERGVRQIPTWSTFTFRVNPGDWRFLVGNQSYLFDCTGFHALSFWIRTDRPLDGKVAVGLRDFPAYLASTDTPRVPLGSDKVSTDWRRVIIPLKPLLEAVPQFQARLLCFVVIAGSDKQPRTFWVDGLTFHPTPESLEADTKRYAND